jgi:hypothetical protein
MAPLTNAASWFITVVVIFVWDLIYWIPFLQDKNLSFLLLPYLSTINIFNIYKCSAHKPPELYFWLDHYSSFILL